MPLSGMVYHLQAGTCTKFEGCSCVRYKDMKGGSECKKMEWFGVDRIHSRSLEISSLDRTYVIFYSTLIQGGPKNGLFSDLITLSRIVLERHAVCQNFRNFIKKESTKLAFQ